MPVSRTVRSALPWLPGFLLGLIAAFYQLHISWQKYDDEGYLLVSLWEYVERGGQLYDQVYTQYGPAYYLIFGTLFRLTGAAVTNDAGRLIVTVIWSCAGTAFGLVAWKATGRLLVGLATQQVGIAALWILVAEPMHPVGLMVLLTAIAMLLIAGAASAPERALPVLGIVLALIGLTKLNIGAFFAIGLLGATTIALDRTSRQWLAKATIAALILMPVALMFSALDQAWAQRNVLLVSGALAVATIPLLRGASPRDGIPVKTFALAAGAALLSTLVILVATLLTGSSVKGMWEGIVVQPMKLKDVAQSVPPGLNDAALLWLAGSAALAWVVATVPRPVTATLDRAAAIGRGVAGLTMWFTIIGTPPVVLFAGSGRLIPPMLLAWLVLWPGRTVRGSEWWARLALVLVALMGALQTFPVAGTQVFAASVAFIPLGGLLIADAIDAWQRIPAPSVEWANWRVQITGGLLIIALSSLVLVGPARQAIDSRATYRSLPPLRVNGADRIHLADAANYERITSILRDRCDRFISYPSSLSFHLWTNQRPLSGMNAGDWAFLLSPAQQQPTVDAAARISRLCLVRNDEGAAGWQNLAGFPPPRGPLLDLVMSDQWNPIETIGPYAISIRKASSDGSSAAPARAKTTNGAP